MAYYIYEQNNSGGSFDIDENVTVTVVIEADSAKEANAIALDKGIYFDGVSDERDCACCGDRWHPTTENEYDKETTVEGLFKSNHSRALKNGQPYMHIYHKNRSKQTLFK